MDEIEELIVEEDRSEHIAKHNVTIKEVEGVLSGDYAWIKAKLGRFMAIGKTKRGKFLKERSFYQLKQNTTDLSVDECFFHSQL